MGIGVPYRTVEKIVSETVTTINDRPTATTATKSDKRLEGAKPKATA